VCRIDIRVDVSLQALPEIKPNVDKIVDASRLEARATAEEIMLIVSDGVLASFAPLRENVSR
jgi:hypothetical protein